jgi:hypothetical protein
MSEVFFGETAFGHLSITNQSYAYKGLYPQAVGCYYRVALVFQFSTVVYKQTKKKWVKRTKKAIPSGEGKKDPNTRTKKLDLTTITNAKN